MWQVLRGKSKPTDLFIGVVLKSLHCDIKGNGEVLQEISLIHDIRPLSLKRAPRIIYRVHAIYTIWPTKTKLQSVVDKSIEYKHLIHDIRWTDDPNLRTGEYLRESGTPIELRPSAPYHYGETLSERRLFTKC